MATKYISANAYECTKDKIKSLGYNLVEVFPSTYVSQEVSSHADLFYCRLGIEDDSTIYKGDFSKLSPGYKGEAIYNAASTGKFFFYNPKITASDIVRLAEKLGQELVPIKQGYCRCNILPLDKTHIITPDIGIAKACKGISELEVLLISTGNVKLDGFPYGFLPGAGGICGDKVIFNGDLSKHPNFNEIQNFAEKCGQDIIYFPGLDLVDIGSIV